MGRSRGLAGAACAGLLIVHGTLPAQVVLTQGTNIAPDVSPSDGSIALDLLGGIWVLPESGGLATLLTDTLQSGKRPRWSPGGSRIVYQATAAGASQLWLIDADSGESRKLSHGGHFDQHPSWHPDGDRVVFSSARRTTGFDIWETDLPTGLAWRLSDHPGDETEPAWSADGRHLAYVWNADDRWALVLRRSGEPEVNLVVSETPLAAPAWRPDGSLLTFLQQENGAYTLNMVILSDPPLARRLAAGEDFFPSPVSWRDRDRFVYAADGRIKGRDLDGWQTRPVSFRAVVGRQAAPSALAARERDLPVTNPPDGRLVVRAARLYDGTGDTYRANLDIVIEGGVISAVEPRREHDDATVLDLGNTTVLPGYIDAYAALPQGVSGIEILSWGVTTLVSPDASVGTGAGWDTESTPGPRILRAVDLGEQEPAREAQDEVHLVAIASEPNGGGEATATQRDIVRAWQALGVPVLAESWLVGLGVGADLLLGADALPASPMGNRYQDMAAAGNAPVILVSGLADNGTPGLDALFRARQAAWLRRPRELERRLALQPDFRGSRATLIAGSRPNGLPPGMALHAELRALAASGLAGASVLRSAGANAAMMLGLDGKLGRIAPGAAADLVLVNGDPLQRVGDTLQIVAVVRNGRFYSLISLLERIRSDR
ncbi:MAG: amidohydrolase family protein [Gammaproteobacteria bacterium]|nr:amidohydrolase family protein [Gammaproteobacteria bacterium]MDH4254397.1 amidohydrolase family protein [Gammaproteobacteria bacterium]MDH5309330.1 amidohydrolase family protein [Gammaproteobacteria bacterium]